MNTNDAPITPPAPTTDPPATGPRPARGFFHSLRDDKPRWWKPVLVLVLLVVGYLIANVIFSIAAFAIEFARGTMDMDQLMDPASMQMTPVIFGSALLSLVVLWPLSILIHKIFYPNRPAGALFSVVNRFRWRWAAKAAVIALVIQGIYYTVATITFPDSIGLSTGLVENALPWFLTVIILMPAQAASEEIAFRGLLGRSVGALFARAGVAVAVALAVSTIAFGQAHFAGDPWLIAYYTGFGLLMGVVTWKTGGIEGAVALHVVNNLLSGGLGALFSDMSGGIDRSAGNGSPAILIHLGVLIIIGALLIWLARRDGLDVATAPQEQPAVAARAVADPWTPTPHRRTVPRDDTGLATAPHHLGESDHPSEADHLTESDR